MKKHKAPVALRRKLNCFTNVFEHNECETVLECMQAMFNIIAEEAFKTVDLAELHYADPDSSDGKDYIS